MKENANLSNYKLNYEQFKRAMEKYSSNLLEFLSYEAKGVSEKGLRKLIHEFGEFRRSAYVANRKNKELYFKASDIINYQFKNFKRIKK